MSRLRQIKLIVAALAALLAVIVAVQNTGTVQTKLLFVTVALPQTVLVFVAFLLGAVIGLLAATFWPRKKSPPAKP